MKITNIQIYPIKLPLIKPFVISYDTYPDMPSLIIKMETDTGLIGYGESVPDEHVTGESFYSTYALLKHNLIPKLIGQNPFNIERIHDIMDKTVKNAPSAKAPLDIACYDIMGKATNQPIYNLIGGQYWDYLEIPHVLSIGEPEKMAKEALEAVNKGFTTIKIKVGDKDIKKDVQRIQSIRKSVGEQIKLRVDVNQGWINSAQSLMALKELEDCNMDWIEQPVLADDIQGLAKIRNQITIPVMIDEGLHGQKELYEAIKLNAVDMINIKLMKCGGIYPALKLIHQAKMANIQCQIGSMVESCIASSAGAHLSLAQKNVISNEMVGPLMFTKDLGKMDYQGNKLYLSQKPGLGVDIDEDIIKELTFMI